MPIEYNADSGSRTLSHLKENVICLFDENSILEEDLAEEIIAMECEALDRWGKGDPRGFTEISAAEVTYYNPYTERRLDGLFLSR
jgi:hypothetical protein